MEPVNIKSILCPVDFSRTSIRAYGYASSLAQHYGARLFVQHVVESWRHPSASFAPSADMYIQFCQDLRVEAEKELHDFLQKHLYPGIHPESVISEGLAKNCILAFAREQAASLIVMGTHGRRGFDRLMLGSVTEKVLREAHCPVLTIPGSSAGLAASETEKDVSELRRILFCTDFSEYSNRALDYALSLAAEYNSEVTLVHVLDHVSSFSRDEEIIKATEDLGKLIPPGAKKNYTVATAVRIGSAYKEIVELSREKDADLAVLAVRGRNAVDLAVFGSTTYRVIHLGTCPVLAVHL